MKFKVLLFIAIISVVFLSGCTTYPKDYPEDYVDIPCLDCNKSINNDEFCKPICEEVFNDAETPLISYMEIRSTGSKGAPWEAMDVSCRCEGNQEDLDKITNSANRIMAEGKEIHFECQGCNPYNHYCFWGSRIQCRKQQKGYLANSDFYYYDGKSVCAGDCYEANDEQKIIIRAVTEKNPDLCNQIQTSIRYFETSKESCFFEYAWWSGDFSICENIIEASQKEKCYEDAPQKHEELKIFIEN